MYLILFALQVACVIAWAGLAAYMVIGLLVDILGTVEIINGMAQPARISQSPTGGRAVSEIWTPPEPEERPAKSEPSDEIVSAAKILSEALGATVYLVRDSAQGRFSMVDNMWLIMLHQDKWLAQRSVNADGKVLECEQYT